MTSEIDQVQREFQRMTMEREVAANQRSQTEGKIYETEEGTVAEYTSTSAAHPRRKSPHEERREHVSSVTKRRVFTRNSPAERASRTSSRSTSPHVNNADAASIRRGSTSSGGTASAAATTAAAATTSFATQQQQQQQQTMAFESSSSSGGGAAFNRPMPQPFYTGSNNNNGVTTTQSRCITSNTRMLQPVDMAVWVKTPQRSLQQPRREETYNSAYDDAASNASGFSVGSSSARRSVNWGEGIDTRVIEPSRVSPLNAIGDYTHVTYMTTRQLQRLRRERERASAQRSVSESIRSSSVPRLDSALEGRRLHAGRSFAPAGGDDAAAAVEVRSSSSTRSNSVRSVRSGSNAGAPPVVVVDEDEVGFYSQGPIGLDPRRAAEIERLSATEEEGEEDAYDVRTTAPRRGGSGYYNSSNRLRNTVVPVQRYSAQSYDEAAARERRRSDSREEAATAAAQFHQRSPYGSGDDGYYDRSASRSAERRHRAAPTAYVSPAGVRSSSNGSGNGNASVQFYSPPPQVPVFGNQSSMYAERRSGGSNGRTAVVGPNYINNINGAATTPRRSVTPVRSNGGGSYRSTPTRVRVPPTMAMPEPEFTLKDVAAMLCRSRKLREVPRIPPYGEEAFALLKRGTHLIKYAATGNPHERFFALRVLADKNQVHQPCFVWSIHAESQQPKEHVHLLLLAAVGTGVANQGYRKSLVASDQIKGPFAGSHRPTLPTDYALNLTFMSATATRQVDLLALDDQTFRCWLLVCNYLATINSIGIDDETENQPDNDAFSGFYQQQQNNQNQKSHLGLSFREFRRDFIPEEAGTLAPDTPRSSVGSTF